MLVKIYAGQTGPEVDALLDEIATVTASEDASTIARLYQSRGLQVPAPTLT